MVEVVKSDPVTVDPAPTDGVPPVVPVVDPKPGEKTDPALLLESLRKERAEKKALQAELEVLKHSPIESGGEVFSDEGKVLDSKISNLQAELQTAKDEKILSSLQSNYPALKDKVAEFDEYREANPGMKMETAAKAFLVENNLLETTLPRKGLETGTGGGRVPITTDGSMSAQEADDLRVNNYNEYARRVRSGTLKIK